MKKLLCVVCALATALTFPALAAEGDIQVCLDGRPLAFDTAPMAAEGWVLVPFRGIFEALGYRVDWDGGAGIAAVSGEHTLRLTLGEAALELDGQIHPLDVPPMAVEGCTLVPLRAVAEASGCDVFWDGERSTALIWTPEALPTHFLYDEFSTDGVYLYAFSFRGTLQISLADQSVRTLPLLGAVCQPYEGKLYGRFGSQRDNLAFASYDLTTGEKRPLTEENVGELYVYEDHIYGTIPGVGFGRMDLDGSHPEALTVQDERAGTGYFALRDGLLFSPGGWVLDLETGETAARLKSGVEAEGWRDFYTLGGACLSGDWFYVPISFYYSESYPLYPCGVAVCNYKTGASGFLPMDQVVEDTQAVGDTLYYTVSTGEGGEQYRHSLPSGQLGPASHRSGGGALRLQLCRDRRLCLLYPPLLWGDRPGPRHGRGHGPVPDAGGRRDRGSHPFRPALLKDSPHRRHRRRCGLFVTGDRACWSRTGAHRSSEGPAFCRGRSRWRRE